MDDDWINIFTIAKRSKMNIGFVYFVNKIPKTDMGWKTGGYSTFSTEFSTAKAAKYGKKGIVFHFSPLFRGKSPQTLARASVSFPQMPRKKVDQIRPKNARFSRFLRGSIRLKIRHFYCITS